MPFEPDNVDPSQLGNKPLRRAIAKLCEDPSLECREEVLESFGAGPLILGVSEIPEGLKTNQWQVIKGEIDIEWLTSEGPEGIVVLAFTDIDALNARAPGCPFIAMEPDELLRSVLSGGYSGIVINPDGPWASISRDEIANLAGVEDEEGQVDVVTSSENPRESIKNALARLVHRPNEDASLVFEDENSGKYIQFIGNAADQIIMDLPCQGLTEEEFNRAKELFQEATVSRESLESNRLGFTPDSMNRAFSFQKGFDHDVHGATQTALAIFWYVYGLPSTFTLLIKEN